MFGTASETSKTYNARESALIKAGYLAEYDGTLMPTSITYINDLGEEVTQDINKYDQSTAYATGRSLAKTDRLEGRPNRYAQPTPTAEPPDLAIKAATESRCDGATIVRTIGGVVLGVYSPYQDRGYLVSNNQRDITAVLLDSPGDCINWLILASDKDQQHYEDLVAVHDIMHGRVTFAPMTLEATMISKLQERLCAMSEV